LGWRDESKIKEILRVVSFALPVLIAALLLLLCWRRHFAKQSIEAACFGFALCLYLARFLNRRSRGLAASFFYASSGPERSDESQDQSDVGGLWGAAIFLGGTAYTLFKFW
jgi:hypothetical protein